MQLDTLCFATYTRNLKVALAESMSDEDLVRVLLSCILSKIPLRNKNGDPFDFSKTLASDYLRQERTIPKAIRDSADAVQDSAEQYFTDRIIPLIKPILMADLVDAQT